MTKLRRSEIGLFFAAVIADQITKALAAGCLGPQGSIPVIRGFFYLTFTENSGAAWSMLQGQMGFFYIITVIALACFIWYLGKTPAGDRLVRIALVLMIAGTLGNFIDRLFLHQVRDFLDFYIFGYDFPIFNLADSELVIGAGLLIVSFLRRDSRHA